MLYIVQAVCVYKVCSVLLECVCFNTRGFAGDKSLRKSLFGHRKDQHFHGDFAMDYNQGNCTLG